MRSSTVFVATTNPQYPLPSRVSWPEARDGLDLMDACIGKLPTIVMVGDFGVVQKLQD